MIGLAVVLAFSAAVGWENLGRVSSKASLKWGYSLEIAWDKMARPMAGGFPVIRNLPRNLWPALSTLPDGTPRILARATAQRLVGNVDHFWDARQCPDRAVPFHRLLPLVRGPWHPRLWLSDAPFLGGPAGCLAYARYDFPFQVYSILFLFLVECAALFTLSHKSY